MGQLFDIVEAYRARFEPHPPKYRQVALLLDVSPQTVHNWNKPMSRLPTREHLESLSRLTGEPLWRVVQAALNDVGLPYLPTAAGNRDSA